MRYNDWLVRKTEKLQAGSGVGCGGFPSQPRAGYVGELIGVISLAGTGRLLEFNIDCYNKD